MSLHRLINIASAAAAGILLLCSSGATVVSEEVPATRTPAVTSASDPYERLYHNIGIPDMDYDAFEQAITGYERIPARKKNVLVLIDYSKPSTSERLYVIDVPQHKLLYKSLVAHGRGSGDNYATSFSNVSGSHKSSLGFYLTGDTYRGRNGYSLRLMGLEEGINDNAYERAIVIHGADYCASSFIETAGRLGRSFGCPALPKELNTPIIDTIKDGAVVFIYGADDSYPAHSPILSPQI